jgi:hypothetical protein
LFAAAAVAVAVVVATDDDVSEHSDVVASC